MMATSSYDSSTQDNVVKQLNELFGKVLNLDVIRTVANSCQYDVVKSSNRLIEISSFYSARAFTENMDVNKDETTFSNSWVNTSKTNNSANNLNLMPRSMTSSTSSVTSSKSRKATDFERTITFINQGYKVLVILRGVPGSGKSYLAKQILEATIGYDFNYRMHILSTDDFFCQNRQGLYMYNGHKISEAHNWNQSRAFQSMSRGFSPVIIDNTNVKMWEMKPYATMATDYGYIVEIIEPNTTWAFNDKELARRNVHQVPRSKIKDMIENYDRNISPRKLLNDYNLVYKLQKPPQLRLYPPPDLKVDPSQNRPPPNISPLQKDPSVNFITASALNRNNEDVKPIETIDLMEFDDETASTTKVPLELGNSTREQNLVDDFLMCNESEPAKVLQPTQNDVLIDSDDEVSTKPKKNLFSDIQKAWGIDERSLRSWDIVTPIKDDEIALEVSQQLQSVEKIQMSQSECNTDDKYFRFIANGFIEGAHIDDLKILTTVNRDINWATPKHQLPVLKKPMLDKSCMTEDIYEDSANHLFQLANVFPDIPEKHLTYWYKKCKGDLEWTIEFLLETQKEADMLIEDSDSEDQNQTSNNDDETKIDRYFENHQETPVVTKKLKKNKNNSSETNELKKIIESKVNISTDHYSEKLLKVKQYRENGSSSSKPEEISPVPSTSNNKTGEGLPTNSKLPENDDDIICIDSDGFEDIDVIDKMEGNVEDTIELNLGAQFVAQLEQLFGDPDRGCLENYQPVVQLPISLARQLYTFYVESVYQQMDNQKQVLDMLAKEDEEFARKLQADENIGRTPEPIVNFKDIVEEQIVLSKNQKEVDKWKNLNPDNLAAKLTRQKLFSLFPSIDKDTLIEILFAHDNKYKETIESLMASTGMDKFHGIDDAINEPPINDETLSEMREAQQNNISEEEYTEIHEASYYREKAKKYLEKRTELYQKAQQYYQRGMIEVAQFYSALASKQTQLYEKANSFAATMFLEEHANRLEKFNTLDLHFLRVKEALEALDVFLDRNINLVRSSTKKSSESLQIITGRGKHSLNGVPKIRPAVIRRLSAHQIKYLSQNSGCLKIKITKNSLLTNEISEN